MLGELRSAIARAALAGIKLDAIEDQIISQAPIDEEQKAALWLYAQAVLDRPARLIVPDDDFVRVNRT
ncbi:MAG: hypothetical protein ACLP01_03030 [Solirubrobacteraceae bacterium]